jgi:hypothetical protein
MQVVRASKGCAWRFPSPRWQEPSSIASHSPLDQPNWAKPFRPATHCGPPGRGGRSKATLDFVIHPTEQKPAMVEHSQEHPPLLREER